MDRNHTMQVIIVVMHASLSARRAWIEMYLEENQSESENVALRKESVDRNIFLHPPVLILQSRSPQGERG